MRLKHISMKSDNCKNSAVFRNIFTYIFIAGVIALVILGANVINGGNWLGTIGFAIISFVCFTVYKIQNDEY